MCYCSVALFVSRGWVVRRGSHCTPQNWVRRINFLAWRIGANGILAWEVSLPKKPLHLKRPQPGLEEKGECCFSKICVQGDAPVVWVHKFYVWLLVHRCSQRILWHCVTWPHEHLHVILVKINYFDVIFKVLFLSVLIFWHTHRHTVDVVILQEENTDTLSTDIMND